MTNLPEKSEKLLFIFDVDSLPENKISLFFKRNLTPSKIECPLYRIMHDAKGIHPQITEYLEKFGLSYEILYRNDFIKKYESYEIFGTFRVADATYPSVYIVVGSEREERHVYELVAARYFNKCDSVSCFTRIMERKYNQFTELGPEEFKKRSAPGYKPENDEEKDEKEEKKLKIENAHQKIADMENEIKSR